MTSNNSETPRGTSLARALDDEDGFLRSFQTLGQFSEDFHDTETLSSTSVSHIAPLISPTLANFGAVSSSMVGGERGYPVRDQNLGESAPEFPASQHDAPSPNSPGFLSHNTPPLSENVPPNSYGQQDYALLPHHHPYLAGPGYMGPYALSTHHMDMAHSPPPFAYHGYHHAFSPPPQTPYSYPHHARDDPRSSPYSTSPHQAMSSAGQGTNHGAFVYPSPYASVPEYAYQPASPPQYPPQYGQVPYQPSVERDRQMGWWYMAPGPPLSSPPFEVSPPYHPGFQRHYTYPLPPLRSSASDSSQPSTSAAASDSGTSHASLSAPTSQASPTQQGASSSSVQRAGSSQSIIRENEEKGGERPLVRRAYHPRPPIQRSDWTMWAGNVPADATRDELWGFFSHLLSVPLSAITDTQPVVSVFLINRSSCAFINYDTEMHLNEAIEHFNGKALRPNDSRCPKLLCRVRKKDDDLRTGVGAQRGVGVHANWVKEKNAKKQATPPPDAGSSVRVMSSLSSSSDEEHRRRKKTAHSSSSGSYTSSTTSSFLARNFPRRYFILKSLTQHDLDLSVEKGLWATQKHNEGVLDQAFRTSQEVFLIFGVNKSGEFYGFARMTSPIQSGEQQVAWEARKPGTPSSVEAPLLVLSPSDHRLVDESPQPVSSSAQADAKYVQTAPAEIGPREKLSPGDVPPARHTFELSRLRPKGPSKSEVIRLDPEAPKRAMRRREENAEELVEADEAKDDEQDEGYEDVEEHSWGQPFRVEWLSTERLPFFRTKHLRNPWNHDREVKVSRDGTELEPIVGQRMIDEWHALATAPVEPGPLPSPSAGMSGKVKRASAKRNKAGS